MDYDYIIVGAGSAGCVLANRLSADPACQVLLLEAGPPDDKLEIRIPAAFAKLFKTKYDWNYATEPQPALANRSLYWPRGKTLGGSSSINAMMHVRGHPADYDAWALCGNAGWGFADVLPVFKDLEGDSRGASNVRGGAGPMRVSPLRYVNPATRAFLAAAEKRGLEFCDDINNQSHNKVTITTVTHHKGRRWSSADAFLRPARGRKNLEIATGAHVTRIVLEHNRAAGVTYVAAGKTETARARGEVILSAGAVNSPQLLMLSGIGAPAGLERAGIAGLHDLPGVGRNLRDHLACGVVVHSPRQDTLTAAERPVELLKWLLFRRGMLASNVAEACAFLGTSPELLAPNLELLFAPVPFVNHGLTKPKSHGISIGAVVLCPESQGRISLRSANPLDAPAIDPGYLTDGGNDMRVMLYGMRMARELLASAPMSDFVGAPMLPDAYVRSDAQLETFIRQHAETLYHPVGTCRMGHDDMAVVDDRLRVRGIDGLRVADASVMPAIIRGHTHSPTVMIAEKGSRMILEDINAG